MELIRGELLAFQPVSQPAQGRQGLRPQSLTTSATGELGTTVIRHSDFVIPSSLGISSFVINQREALSNSYYSALATAAYNPSTDVAKTSAGFRECTDSPACPACSINIPGNKPTAMTIR